MDYQPINQTYNDEKNVLRQEALKYLSFWPLFFPLLFIFLIIAFLFVRYSPDRYESVSVIEILDESQNNEMALPTELTVFNRSMINLENEVNILKSYSINSDVVKKLDANILYYGVGKIRSTQKTKEQWFKDYKLTFKVDTDQIVLTTSYDIDFFNGDLSISKYDAYGNFVSKNDFNGLTTTNQKHELPFELSINDNDISESRKLILNSVRNQVNQFRNNFQVSPLGKDSDQLLLKITHENINIAEQYLNGLLFSFDNDGINDRQLEYKRTISFVDDREKILRKELDLIEEKKQKFKTLNNLSDLSIDADKNIDLKFTYDSELFDSESQKTLAVFLKQSLVEQKYQYLPINIGFEDFDINNIIFDYNKIVTDRNRILTEAGPNNVLIKSLESQMDLFIDNISQSIDNYLSSIEIKIEGLREKELEFENIYQNVPQNERTLRSIERELSIKEALYLLLLQKKEEAAINLAVVKPTIKIIDYPYTNPLPVYPRSKVIYLSAFILSVVFFFSAIYLWFFFDNKIHSKEQLAKILNKDIPIIGEIPFIKDKSQLKYIDKIDSRSILAESIRMLVSNLKLISSNLNKKKCSTIIFTSSVKGEGKTLASTSAALNLSKDLGKKVALVGLDLRNPQVHKIFGFDRSDDGITDIFYKSDLKNYKSYIKKFDNLDIFLSGTIPPNPTSILASDSLKEFIQLLSNEYDYLIIDSAPCLLVSDSFQLFNYADEIVYLFRSNHTDIKIAQYINDLYNGLENKNLNIVLNAVGNSSAYGYKYNYQYGYRYKYTYNYGYGYGYGSDQ